MSDNDQRGSGQSVTRVGNGGGGHDRDGFGLGQQRRCRHDHIDGSTIADVTRDTNLGRGAFRAFTRIDATTSQPLPTNLIELGHSGDTADGAMSASIASNSGWSPNGFQQAAGGITPTHVETGVFLAE